MRREETFGGPTKRLQEYLTDDELDTMRELQNRVVPKMQLPTREFLQQMRDSAKRDDPSSLIDAYLETFKPVTRQYRRNQDVSLMYRDGDDARMWAEFVLKVLPRIVVQGSEF